MATSGLFSTRLGERWRAIDPAWRCAIGVYLAARVFYFGWGFVIVLFVPAAIQNLDWFGEPIGAYFDLQTSERFVFSRRVGERVLTFHVANDGTLTDAETQSVWSPREAVAVQGAMAGAKLEAPPLTIEDLFPYHGVEADRGLFRMWQRWDVLWYQAIAERGYAGEPNAVHFPPLYPLLEAALGSVFGGRYFFAGWLIAQGALVGSLALLYRMTERWEGTSTARRVVVFAVLVPTAFFFFTAYSESLFLLLSLLCFVCLERERWGWAGFWAFLAILTRLQGIALLVPLAYCAWVSSRADRKVPWKQVGMLALPVTAVAVYLGLRLSVGDGNVVPTNEPGLNARLALPWENIAAAVQAIAEGKFLMADVLNLSATALAICLVAFGWRRLPTTMALYCAATITVVMLRNVDTQPLNSMTRYLLTLFPLVMLVAYWTRKGWVERAVVYVCVPLSLYLCSQFLIWGWVA